MAFDRGRQIVRTGSAATVDNALGPGKRTLTEQLLPQRRDDSTRSGSTAAASGTATAARGTATPATRPPRMGTAMRPDRHPEPAQHEAEGEAASREAPRDDAGKAMPGEVQVKMESAFGADFSGVRIHQGPSAQALGALAYTQGPNVHFAPGWYQPESQKGQELLGHELAHVVQQSQGRVQATTQGEGMGVNDDAGLEREADDMGAKAARGERAGGAARLSGVEPPRPNVQVSGNGTQIAQCYIDTSMSLGLSTILNEHTSVLSLMAEFNHQEGQLLKDDEIDPFAKTNEPREMPADERLEILRVMDEISGQILSQCLAVKGTDQYRELAQMNPVWVQRFDRIIRETGESRRRWYEFVLQEEAQGIDYARYYNSFGHIALLERIREDNNLGSANEYIFLPRDVFLERAISMGYEESDLRAGIGVNYGATVGGPALPDKKRSPVSYMYINEEWVKAWLQGNNYNNLVHTMEHEYCHVQQHRDPTFVTRASTEPGASLAEVNAYRFEINRFVDRLRAVGGDVTDRSLPGPKMVEDAVNAFLVHYDELKEPRRQEFKNFHEKVDQVLFEMRANEIEPYRALLKVFLPEYYKEDSNEGSGYEML